MQDKLPYTLNDMYIVYCTIFLNRRIVYLYEMYILRMSLNNMFFYLVCLTDRRQKVEVSNPVKLRDIGMRNSLIPIVHFVQYFHNSLRGKTPLSSFSYETSRRVPLLSYSCEFQRVLARRAISGS